MDMLIERVMGEDLDARLDGEGRRIRDIAMLRSQSKNGYRYSVAAMQAAARLFEGAPAYLDHPPQMTGAAGKPGVARANGATGGHSVRDLIGRFTNVRLQGDLVRGDLQLLPGPEGDKVLALAEQMPSAVGFSIEAQGILTQQGGEKIVTELTAARGVALVTEPAATRGLFEGRQNETAGPVPPAPAKAYAPPSLEEQVDALRAEDPELYQAVVLAEDRRREAIRAAARRQRLGLSESTVAKLAGHGSLEQGLHLLEALAADLRHERAADRGPGVQSLPARVNDRRTQLETELTQRLIEAE